jgi:hypothetical protein
MIDNRPQADRILVARLSGAAGRLFRWGALDDAQADAGAAELRELAGGRGDLLAEVAGLSLGTSERNGPEYVTQAEAIALLCRAAGADPEAISEWTEEGRRRAAAARRPPADGEVRGAGAPRPSGRLWALRSWWMLSVMLGGRDPCSPFERLMLVICAITGRRPGDHLPPVNKGLHHRGTSWRAITTRRRLVQRIELGSGNDGRKVVQGRPNAISRRR